jgi:uncharacterized delta-60 repeat protein
MAIRPLRETRRPAARRSAFVLLFAVLGVGPSQQVRAQIEGTLDPSFYFDGKYFLPPSAGDQTIHDLVVAPDGRLVIAGYRAAPGGQSTLFWAALDGVTAPTICSPVTVAGGTSAAAYAATFDDQGRLLLAGKAIFGSDGNEGIALRYLYPACDLDETFNLDGVFMSSQTIGTSYTGIAVDSHSRVVLSGRLAGQDGPVLAVRLSNSGLYDFDFAGDGRLELDLGEYVEIEALRLQADDRILLAGSVFILSDENRNFLALRLDQSGDLDATFSGDGVAHIDFDLESDLLNDLAVDPVDGGLILVGRSGLPPVAAVARLTANGVLDSSFGGGDGRWTHSVLDATELNAVEVQSDRKLLLAGGYSDLGNWDFVAMRLTPSGSLDHTFGFLGAAGVAFDLGGGMYDACESATLQNGKLLLAGSANDDEFSAGAVARLWIALLFTDGFESGGAGQWSARLP